MQKSPRFLPALLCLSACTASPPELAGSLQQRALEDGWVGTWAASPQTDGTSFQDKTLRQIVRTSIGGTRVRIRVSNVYGNQPLVVDNAHVAERQTGSSIVMSTDRSLKFDGQASVSIPAGQTALSDAVDFEVKAWSDLAVSFHLASTNDRGTAHGTGLQENYVASGNVAGDAALGGAQTRGSYYFLTNVDVQNTEAWGSVVTLGASITDGVASGANNNRRWPNDLAKRLIDAKIPVGVLNQGISGNRLLADGTGDSALKRFERDVLGQPGVRWVIFSDDPINDLGGGNPPSGAQLIDGLRQLVAKAHGAGIEFWCSTLTPFEGAGYWKPAGETGRGEVNAFVKSPDSGCDALVDQDAATHDPKKPTWYLPAFDAGDHLHPNEQGLQAIADAVKLDGFTPPPSVGGEGGNAVAGTANAGEAGRAATSGGAGTTSGGSPSSGVSGGGATTTSGGVLASGGSGNSSGTSPLAPAPVNDSSGCTVGSVPADSSNWMLILMLGLGSALARRRPRASR